MKILIKIVLILFLFQNCSSKKKEPTLFQISNISGDEITKLSINIRSGKYSRNIYEEFNVKNGFQDSFTITKDYLPNQDGDYGIYINTKLTSRVDYFGFFSNGYDAHSEYRIVIKPDSVLVELKNKDF